MAVVARLGRRVLSGHGRIVVGMLSPWELEDRLLVLKKRGLTSPILADLWTMGTAVESLLQQVEALTPADISQLNAVALHFA